MGVSERPMWLCWNSRCVLLFNLRLTEWCVHPTAVAPTSRAQGFDRRKSVQFDTALGGTHNVSDIRKSSESLRISSTQVSPRDNAATRAQIRERSELEFITHNLAFLTGHTGIAPCSKESVVMAAKTVKPTSLVVLSGFDCFEISENTIETTHWVALCCLPSTC